MTIKMPCTRCGTLAPRRSICPRCGGGVGVKPSATKRGYGYAWQQLSRTAIALQPWCSICGKKDDLTTDHRYPLALGGPVLPTSLDGVQVLCRSCNGKKGSKVPRPR